MKTIGDFLMWIGGIGIGFLFLWLEWAAISVSFLNFVNPFLQLQILVAAMTLKWFWACAGMIIVGLFFNKGNV